MSPVATMRARSAAGAASITLFVAAAVLSKIDGRWGATPDAATATVDLSEALHGTHLMQSSSVTGPSKRVKARMIEDPFDDLVDPFDAAPKATLPGSSVAIGGSYWFTICFDLGMIAIGLLGGKSVWSYYGQDSAKMRLQKLSSEAHAAAQTAAPAATTRFDLNALMRAAGDETLWRQILDESPGITTASDEWGCSALHAAAACGCAEMAQELVRRGANVAVVDAWRETPLHFAARAGSMSTVQTLLAGGAEVDALNADDRTPSFVAAHTGHEAALEVLFESGGGAGGACDEELPPLFTSLMVRRMLMPLTVAA